MTNLELEKKISTAFDDIAPDHFEKIYENFQQKQKIRKKKILYKSMISIAAIFVIVVTTAISLKMAKQYNTVDSRICFDINPSIALEVNKNGKVLSDQANNKDAETVLKGQKLKGENLSKAVDIVINATIKHGYIDEESNSVLVSVDHHDFKKGEELQKKLSEEVSKTLQKYGVEGAVLSQALDHAPETKKLADTYGISEGKTQLINKILKIKEDYTFDDLANLSINELNLLCDSGRDMKGHIDANGIASDKRYIGKEKAKEIAFNAINITEEDITNYECNLILEKGKMIYDITFVVGISGQQIDIDAMNGEIIRNSLAVEEEKESEEEKDKTEGNTAAKIISEKKAKKIAYEHARVVDKKKKHVSAGYWSEDKIYYVSFTCEGYEYFYRISNTGKIVRNSKWIVDYRLLENISEKKVKKVTFSHLGIEEALAIGTELTLNDEKMEYYLSFQYDKYKYVYTIHSKIGEIENITKELTDTAISEGFTEVELIDEATAKRIVFNRLNVTEDEVSNYNFIITQGTADESLQVYYISFRTPKYYSCQFDLDMKTGLVLYSEVEDAS